MKDNPLVQAEELEKIRQELVSMGDGAGNPLAGLGQNQAAVLFIFEQSLGVEPLDHIGYACLGNLQCRSDIDNSRIPFRINQFENSFEVIFNGSRSAGGTDFFRAHDLDISAGPR